MPYIRTAIAIVLEIMNWAIFARAIISWLPISRESGVVNVLYQITEPILAPIRSIIQKSAFGQNMMVDFSPIIAFLLIRLIQNFI